MAISGTEHRRSLAGDTAPRSERVTLLEAIVIFAISAAIIIFIFAMGAAALGDYQFRLPAFLTDSVKTMWSLVAAGGVAVTGSSLDLVLRREPRRTNYLIYILATTAVLFAPIVGLMLYGKSAQDFWSVPSGATPISILSKSFPKRSFSLSTLVSPSPVGLYLSGDVALSDGHIKGTASGRITKSGTVMAVPPNYVISQVAIHLCYYQRASGSQFVTVAVAPRFPERTNMASVSIPLPLLASAVDVASFGFDVEVPEMAHPEAAWLCGVLSDRNNVPAATVQ